jgi:predicted secreted hydrolase
LTRDPVPGTLAIMRAGPALFGLSSLLLGALLATSEPSIPAWAFDPDKEEGVHGAVEVEWWYHYGYLTDDAGGEWALFSSFFRFQPKGRGPSRYLLYDLLDLKTGAHDYRSRLGAEAMALISLGSGRTELSLPHGVIPGAPLEKPGDPLDLKYADDTLVRTGTRRYRLKAGEVALELRASSSPMPVEGTGLTGVNRPEEMHYYTIPRLEATGTVKGRPARGTLWYDHQWGASWTGPAFGWSWWGLQLDDGTAVNAYVLREVNAGVRKAVLTREDRVFPLEAEPLEWWESPARIRYPVSWRLRGGGLDLRIEPAFKSREVVMVSGTDTIWEGPVRVTGTVGGRGFQELVGYAREKKAPR